MTNKDVDPASMGGFHWDKRIPVILIIVISAYAASTIWWAATTTSRVEAIEMWILANQAVEARLVRFETLQGTVLEKLDVIDNRLAKIEDKE